VEGNRRFIKQIKELSNGLGVATGAEACERALQLFGVRRLGVVTPYQPVGDQNVVRFFNELGFDVVKITGLRCPTAVSIAHVQEATLRQALLEVNTQDAEALVQVGTNLSMVALADEAERWLGKPVLAINAAIWWMALPDGARVRGAMSPSGSECPRARAPVGGPPYTVAYPALAWGSDPRSSTHRARDGLLRPAAAPLVGRPLWACPRRGLPGWSSLAPLVLSSAAPSAGGPSPHTIPQARRPRRRLAASAGGARLERLGVALASGWETPVGGQPGGTTPGGRTRLVEKAVCFAYTLGAGVGR
jgi:hypothetical protein